MTERERIPQDPGIPGVDTVSDPRDRPIPDEKDEDAERREHPESDDEGHMTPPLEDESPSSARHDAGPSAEVAYKTADRQGITMRTHVR